MLTLGAMLILMGVIYAATQHTVHLNINGIAFRIRTHQRTAEGVLREARIDLYPEDSLHAPEPEALLQGEPIEITIARHVAVVHDGSVTQARTLATRVDDALADADIVQLDHDEYLMQGEPCDLDTPLFQPAITRGLSMRRLVEELRSPVRLTVRRSVPITVQDGAVTLSTHTTARTVGEALHDRGIVIYVGDEVFPAYDTVITPGLSIFIDRAKPITLDIGGTVRAMRTRHKTVQDLLEAENVTLSGEDYVTPDPSTPISSEMYVSVVRVQEEHYIEETPIPYQTRWEADPELEIDLTTVKHWGREGAQRRQIRVRYENDREVERAVEAEWIAHEPIDRVYAYGTRIVVRQIETPAGTMEYWRKIRMLATSYNAPTAGKPMDHPTYGITRTGIRARYGVIAVDPNVINLHQPMYVPGYGVGTALDTGGAIKGRRIDLCYDDHNLVLWNRWVDVYLLTPVPSTRNIPWILPNTPRERE
ncbi:MAG: ubiquitin-like domain-containing protein [Anaerolineae bacterium]|jgi:uncharacterized protein YabE (DUF348 family)